MKSWEDEKNRLQSLIQSEIEEIEAAVRTEDGAKSTSVNIEHTIKTKK